ncbi:MAG: cytochrome c [Acidobacteria bacterium]|nr:cytochrome c [Acidobacteriota bacterium]
MRIRGELVLAIVCYIMVLTGCGPTEQKSVPPSWAVTPRVLYERNCAVCHGARGEGTERGTMKVPPLNSGAALNDPDEKFLKQISEGGNGMPPFKYTLDDQQIEDLVRFVREEIQKK